MSKFLSVLLRFSCAPEKNLLWKLNKLIEAAGFGRIEFFRVFTAIKNSFGEPGNLAFLRPN